ncbi:MAG: HAD hydrolase family protein [bacterium]|nr:HAD hydrolase family protein [bacterium]
MPTLEERMQQIRFIVSDVDGVLTDGTMGFDAAGRHFRHFNVKDGLGLAMWHLADGKVALMSGQGSPAVEAVARQWRCTECLTHVRDKVSACNDLARRHRVEIAEMAFAGDDLIDLDAIEHVGLGVAVGDAADVVKQAAAFTTKARGGEGALRELVEEILRAQGRLDEVIQQYRHGPTGVQ